MSKRESSDQEGEKLPENNKIEKYYIIISSKTSNGT